MSTRLIEFKLENGGTVWVEEDLPPDRGGLVAQDTAPRKAKESFEAALATLKPVTDAIVAQLSDLSVAPEAWEVELGVSLKAEAGLVLAKTAGEANLKLKLTWKRTKSPPT